MFSFVELLIGQNDEEKQPTDEYASKLGGDIYIH
jgi:hypothetical protein